MDDIVETVDMVDIVEIVHAVDIADIVDAVVMVEMVDIVFIVRGAEYVSACQHCCQALFLNRHFYTIYAIFT